MKEKDFNDLLASVREAGAILRGERRPARVTTVKDLLAAGTPDVGLLRAHFKLSQVKFAALLGISVDTLQNWEQGRRKPEGPARVLLAVAAAHPEALLSVARTAPKRRRGRSAA
jgi:putative transcriptional regulator